MSETVHIYSCDRERMGLYELSHFSQAEPNGFYKWEKMHLDANRLLSEKTRCYTETNLVTAEEFIAFVNRVPGHSFHG